MCDVRKLPLSIRKANLARPVDGIGPGPIPARVPDRVERLLISKHRKSTYCAGRFRHWIKIKNREHPAFSRVQDQF